MAFKIAKSILPLAEVELTPEEEEYAIYMAKLRKLKNGIDEKAKDFFNGN